MRNLVKIRKTIFLTENAQIWAFGFKIWKTKISRKSPSSPILKYSFVSGRFGWFGVLESTFSQVCIINETW